MLILDENYSPNGQPSDIFAHMIASLTVSSCTGAFFQLGYSYLGYIAVPQLVSQ